jgi:chemotaxis response regulator CheB
MMPVGVGASAGGLEALKALLPTSPSDDSLPFDIVVHLRPGQPTFLFAFSDRVTISGQIEKKTTEEPPKETPPPDEATEL